MLKCTAYTLHVFLPIHVFLKSIFFKKKTPFIFAKYVAKFLCFNGSYLVKRIIKI